MCKNICQRKKNKKGKKKNQSNIICLPYTFQFAVLCSQRPTPEFCTPPTCFCPRHQCYGQDFSSCVSFEPFKPSAQKRGRYYTETVGNCASCCAAEHEGRAKYNGPVFSSKFYSFFMSRGAVGNNHVGSTRRCIVPFHLHFIASVFLDIYH